MVNVFKNRGKDIQEKEPPVLPVTSWFIWDAFSELSTTRHELGPVPWTALNDFAYRYRITDNIEFDSFCFFIRALDNEYRDIRQKEIERQRQSQQKNTKKKPNGRR